MPTDTDWARLGTLLIRRRVEMDRRYRNRRVFVKERGIKYDVAIDVELKRRTNFEPTTKAVIESAYGLAPGSLDKALAGGDLVTEEQAAQATAPEAAPQDPELAYITDAWPRLDESERRMLASVVRNIISPPASPAAQHRQTA